MWHNLLAHMHRSAFVVVMVVAGYKPVICMRMHIIAFAEAVQHAQINTIYKNTVHTPPWTSKMFKKSIWHNILAHMHRTGIDGH